MKIYSVILIFMVLFAIKSNAQTSVIRYSKTQNFNKEVPLNKANFSQTTTTSVDSIITVEVKNLTNEKIVWRIAYKGIEPFGQWIQNEHILDYEFKLIYDTTKCNEEVVSLNNAIFSNLLNKEGNFNSYLAQNIIYPRFAIKMGIEGSVYIKFTILPDGKLENINVYKGVDVRLDKEAVRVIRGLKFPNSGSKINGIYKPICIQIPVRFKLEY